MLSHCFLFNMLGCRKNKNSLKSWINLTGSNIPNMCTHISLFRKNSSYFSDFQQILVFLDLCMQHYLVLLRFLSGLNCSKTSYKNICKDWEITSGSWTDTLGMQRSRVSLHYFYYKQRTHYNCSGITGGGRGRRWETVGKLEKNTDNYLKALSIFLLYSSHRYGKENTPGFFTKSFISVWMKS